MPVYRMTHAYIHIRMGVYVDDEVMEWVRKFASSDQHCPVIYRRNSSRETVIVFDNPDHPTMVATGRRPLCMVTTELMVSMFKERSV